MKIITNNIPRLLIDAYELSEVEREEFHYLDWAAIDAEKDGATFFRYKGILYDLGEFTYLEVEGLEGWDGYTADSFFTGVVIKLVDSDHIIVGRVLEGRERDATRADIPLF